MHIDTHGETLQSTTGGEHTGTVPSETSDRYSHERRGWGTLQLPCSCECSEVVVLLLALLVIARRVAQIVFGVGAQVAVLLVVVLRELDLVRVGARVRARAKLRAPGLP